MNDLSVQPVEVPSPFLPGTFVQYAWDSTCLSYIKRCPRLYYYKIIVGYRSKGESLHLRFGGEWHQALWDYEDARHNGVDHEEAVRIVVYNLFFRTKDWDPDDPNKNKKALIRTTVWYLEHYRNDKAKTILYNGRPAVELSFRFPLDWGPKRNPHKWLAKQSKDLTIHEWYCEACGEEMLEKDRNPDDLGCCPGPSYLLCGHLDRVVEYLDDPYVMDRKTTKYTPGSSYFDGFDPDNQMSLYTIAGQVLFQTPIRGVIIDAAQILVDSTRFVRGLTYRTSDRLDEWIQDLHYWLALAEHYAKANYWPMNDTACSMYGGCEFRGICSKSPTVREKFLASKWEKGKPWNPLEVR
jgi:hypothetical protein